jgi:hypothetical protein
MDAGLVPDDAATVAIDLRTAVNGMLRPADQRA